MSPGSTDRMSATFSSRRAISPASPTRKSETEIQGALAMANQPIRRIAIIGTGVIGASWAALFLAKGLDVVETDVAPDAETQLKLFVKAAWSALERLGLAPGASQLRLAFVADLPEAMQGADFVQENGPERIDFKKKLYRQLDELLAPGGIIAS